MEALGPEENFLGISERELYAFESSDVVILPIPYEYTSSYISGSQFGPLAIIEASNYVEYYDEVLEFEPYKKLKIATLPELVFDDKIDKAAMDFIEAKASDIINQNKFLIALGAEHSISYPLFLAHQKKYGNIGLLQFDAHSDLRESYNNNKYSHASVIARINEHHPVITQVGIRALCREEAELIHTSDNIHTFFAHQIHSQENWIEQVLNSLPENIYLTIDADGFDPSVIPAVGTPEPNGLDWNQAMQLFERVFKEKNVVGFDVLEMAPKENDIQSPYTLAKLIYRLIGFKSMSV